MKYIFMLFFVLPLTIAAQQTDPYLYGVGYNKYNLKLEYVPVEQISEPENLQENAAPQTPVQNKMSEKTGYFSVVLGGANFKQEVNMDPYYNTTLFTQIQKETWDISYNTGVVFGLELGRQNGEDFRSDLSVIFLKTEVEQMEVDSFSTSGTHYHGVDTSPNLEAEYLEIMGSIYYYLASKKGKRMRPYFGAGLGIGRLDLIGKTEENSVKSNWGLAYKLAFGIDVPLDNSNSTLSIEYSYHHGDMAYDDGDTEVFGSAVLAKLRFPF